MRHFLLLLAGVALTTITACSKPDASSPTEPAPAGNGPAQATGSAADGAGAETPAAAASPAVVNAPVATVAEGSGESSERQEILSEAMARFHDKYKRLPRNFGELVTAGFIKSIPPPPPGKRYGVDPLTFQVVIID